MRNVLFILTILLLILSGCSVSYVSIVDNKKIIDVIPKSPSPENSKLNFEIKAKIPQSVLRRNGRYFVNVKINRVNKESIELEPIDLNNNVTITEQMEIMASKKYQIDYDNTYDGAEIVVTIYLSSGNRSGYGSSSVVAIVH